MSPLLAPRWRHLIAAYPEALHLRLSRHTLSEDLGPVIAGLTLGLAGLLLSAHLVDLAVLTSGDARPLALGVTVFTAVASLALCLGAVRQLHRVRQAPTVLIDRRHRCLHRVAPGSPGQPPQISTRAWVASEVRPGLTDDLGIHADEAWDWLDAYMQGRQASLDHAEYHSPPGGSRFGDHFDRLGPLGRHWRARLGSAPRAMLLSQLGLPLVLPYQLALTWAYGCLHRRWTQTLRQSSLATALGSPTHPPARMTPPAIDPRVLASVQRDMLWWLGVISPVIVLALSMVVWPLVGLAPKPGEPSNPLPHPPTIALVVVGMAGWAWAVWRYLAAQVDAAWFDVVLSALALTACFFVLPPVLHTINERWTSEPTVRQARFRALHLAWSSQRPRGMSEEIHRLRGPQRQRLVVHSDWDDSQRERRSTAAEVWPDDAFERSSHVCGIERTGALGWRFVRAVHPCDAQGRPWREAAPLPRVASAD